MNDDEEDEGIPLINFIALTVVVGWIVGGFVTVAALAHFEWYKTSFATGVSFLSLATYIVIRSYERIEKDKESKT